MTPSSSVWAGRRPLAGAGTHCPRRPGRRGQSRGMPGGLAAHRPPDDDHRDDDHDADGDLLAVGPQQDRQHGGAEVERVVLLLGPAPGRRSPGPASRPGCRDLGSRRRDLGGRGRRASRPRSARPPPVRGRRAAVGCVRRQLGARPRGLASPILPSMQAMNWPSSLSDTSCMTPAAELRRLAGHRQVGLHVGPGRARRRRRSAGSSRWPRRCRCPACPCPWPRSRPGGRRRHARRRRPCRSRPARSGRA